MNIYEYHYVPKIKELNIKLFEYHCNNFYCNEKDLFYIFKENIIKDYVKNCPVCIQNIKTRNQKEQVYSIK